MRHFRHLPLLLLAALLVGCGQHDSTSQANQAPAMRDTVSVTGMADVQATPDQFVVHAAATADGQDVKTISQTVNDQVNKVLTLTQQLNIDKKDVQALSIQISPQWQWQPTRKLLGYEARRDITITLNGMDHYAALMQGLVDIGINDIGQTDAQVANRRELMLNALADAVKDARAKADKLAEAAGRKVDQAIVIQEQSMGQPMPIMMRSLAAKADAPSFEPGTTTLRQQVSVTFSLR